MFIMSAGHILSQELRHVQSEDATINVAFDLPFSDQLLVVSSDGFVPSDAHAYANSRVRRIRANIDNDLPMPISSARITPPVSG